MRFCVIVAILGFSSGFFAAPHNKQILGEAAPARSAEAPQVVSRGAETKRCPATFEPVGKLCIKVAETPSVPICEPGLELTQEGLCAKYVGKKAECPDGYEHLEGGCELRRTSSPTPTCPSGYTLTENDLCTAPVEAKPTEECVNGSIRRGDLCILEEEREPTFSCPSYYELDENKCRIEELYNCTPERSGNSVGPDTRLSTQCPPSTSTPPPSTPPPSTPPPSTPPPSTPPPSTAPPTTTQSPPPSTTQSPPVIVTPPFPTGKGKQFFQTKQGKRFYRQPVFTNIYPMATDSETYNPAHFPMWRQNQERYPAASKEFLPEIIDYVLQATCKRIRTIAALKVCREGILNGKMCLLELEVPPVLIKGLSLEKDVQPATLQCPENYSLLSRSSCVLTETTSVTYTCPEQTQDAGDKCVTYAPPRMTCPPQYALENETTCVQTLEAPPITEYTVSYQCVGKECANDQ